MEARHELHSDCEIEEKQEKQKSEIGDHQGTLVFPLFHLH